MTCPSRDIVPDDVEFLRGFVSCPVAVTKDFKQMFLFLSNRIKSNHPFLMLWRRFEIPLGVFL